MVTCSAWQPMYVAATTILITSQQISRDFVNAPVDADTLANVNAMVGSALSTENLSKLIEDEHLFPDEVDEHRPDRPRLEAARADRTEALPSVSKHSNALVYQISYKSENAEEAARVANALGALFVEESIRHRTAQALGSGGVPSQRAGARRGRAARAVAPGQRVPPQQPRHAARRASQPRCARSTC